MKKIYILTIIFLSFLSYSKEIAVTNIINSFKQIDYQFHQEFEDNFIDIFSNFSHLSTIFLYRNENIYEIKKKIDKNKDNSSDILNDKLFENIKNFEYIICCDVIYYEIKEENNFYDNQIIEYSGIIKFNIIIIQGKNLKIVEDEIFNIETQKSRDKDNIKERLIFLIKEKITKYKDSIIYFKKKIKILKKNSLFIWLNSGKIDGLKQTDILFGYNLDNYNIVEVAKIKIIKVNENDSIGIIIYNNEPITDQIVFLKKENSGINLQIAGGFSLSELERDNLTLYPYLDIKVLIPVGLPFFYPVVASQLNFFLKNNKFIVPFSIETGIQGDFNINRFGIAIGFVAGALFSPDSELRYQIDSIVVKPYLSISAILSSLIVLYFEFGYRYYNENILYNEWKIDLEGIYFTFGINFQL